MTTSLDLEVLIDNSEGFAHVPVEGTELQRDAHVQFECLGKDYRVTAWGPLFPDDGGGTFSGRLAMSPAEAYGAISELRQVWQDEVVDRTAVKSSGLLRYPFADEWDLSSADAALLDEVAPELARAGAKLFDLIFRRGDPGLAEIREHLVQGIRSAPRVLAFHSDDLFVPWSMLYVPPEPGTNLETEKHPSVSLDGFLGHRHLVEHMFSRAPFRNQIVINGLANVGLYVDRQIDRKMKIPFVEDVQKFFTTHANVVVRETRQEVAEAFTSQAFNDQIVYFGCHGVVSGATGQELGRPHLALGDGKPINAGDFAVWLDERVLPSHPLVFVNACQGGQMSSLLYGSFGLELLKRGANSLLGPQVDLPAPFAIAYAKRLFTRFLSPGQRLGAAVRDEAVSFAKDNRNPLGLVFTLYRGLDTYLHPVG